MIFTGTFASRTVSTSLGYAKTIEELEGRGAQNLVTVQQYPYTERILVGHASCLVVALWRLRRCNYCDMATVGVSVTVPSRFIGVVFMDLKMWTTMYT